MVVVMSVHVQYIPPVMIMWSIFWILENDYRINLIRTTRQAYLIIFILFISYYLWEAVGLLYTSDIEMGLLNLFGRLSLVLFPIVLIYPGQKIITNVKLLIRIFAIGTFLSMIFFIGYALYNSLNLHNGIWTFEPHLQDFPWLNYFYGAELTLSQHPTYVAIYVLLSAFISFESWYDYSLKSYRRIIWLSLGLLFLFFEYLLSSRAGILISMVLVPFYFILKFKMLGKSKFAWIWILLIILTLIPIVIKNQRVDYLYGTLFNSKNDNERKEDPRFIIWSSALQVAKDNLLLGVGIGDVRTELVSKYQQIGEVNMAKERYNAHNQFLEVLVENGLIGLILFLGIFGWMSYIAIIDGNILYGIFILMMFMFFLFETVLYRLAGVSFFSMFAFLLIHSTDYSQQQILISKQIT